MIMKKVGIITEKNPSPLWIQNFVHVIREIGSDFVDFRLYDDDFKCLYFTLLQVPESKRTSRLNQLIDLFHSVVSRL